MSCGSSQPRLLGLPSQDWAAAASRVPQKVPCALRGSSGRLPGGLWLFGCKSTRVPWQPLEGTHLAQATGATFKVTVTQCGCALMGSKTESRGASGGHGEKCAGIGVMPGLGWSGSQGTSVGSGGHGAAFLWTT